MDQLFKTGSDRKYVLFVGQFHWKTLYSVIVRFKAHDWMAGINCKCLDCLLRGTTVMKNSASV